MTLGLYSLLLRPARVWRPPLTPFSADGLGRHTEEGAAEPLPAVAGSDQQPGDDA